MRTIPLVLAITLQAVCLAQSENEAATRKIEVTFSLSGAEMFKTWCAPCHGLSGKGDGPAAAALRKAPADLTQLARKNRGKFPVERVREFIEGRDSGSVAAHGSREMPIWGDVFMRISGDPVAVSYRIVTLAAYVESLQTK